MISKSILNSCHEEGIKDQEIYKAYKQFFGTLVSQSRLDIINLLRKGKKNVGEIMQELKMDQTAVSHDLSRLKECGFVLVEIDRKYRYYKLNDETIRPLMALIDKHMNQYCIHIIKEMEGRKHDGK